MFGLRAAPLFIGSFAAKIIGLAIAPRGASVSGRLRLLEIKIEPLPVLLRRNNF